MMRSGLLFLALLCSVSGEETAKKNRPVSKVINLLKDMQKQLEKEGEEDEEVYDKMVCWCETNDKEKTKSIATAEQHLADLAASIEELTASSAGLTSDIGALQGEIEASTRALDQATALREKELAEFNAAEKDSLNGIASLKSAVVTLSKHNKAALLQGDDLDKIAVMVRAQLRKKTPGLVTPKERRVLEAFVQGPTEFMQTAFLQKQMPSAGSYAPQSGQVFGILKNMKETFEANLAAAQKGEATAASTYASLKAAKEKEIAAATAQVETKTQERAAADEKCAVDKEDTDDTTTTLNADREFLAMLKSTCANMDAQMAERQKTRAMEIEAVSKALAILAADDAHDLFSKTLSFVQRSSQTVVSDRRLRAAKLVNAAAIRSGSPQLSFLATSIRLDAFGAVKKNIEKMINDLVKEKEDEIKHKDYCVEEMNENERATAEKNRQKDHLQARIDDQTETITALTQQINALNNNVAEMQLQMKRAGEDREIANKEFQETVADQRATQKLLNQALNALKGFYGVQTAAKNAEKKQPYTAGPAPPPGFKNYENNRNSGGVMGMIQMIISDAKAMEAEAIRGEMDSQKAYEEFMKDSNDSIDGANTELVNKGEEKAKVEGDKAESDMEMDAVMANLQQLSNQNRDLHGDCDFVVKNFDIRQSARDDELEALKESIAILSGAQQ